MASNNKIINLYLGDCPTLWFTVLDGTTPVDLTGYFAMMHIFIPLESGSIAIMPQELSVKTGSETVRQFSKNDWFNDSQVKQGKYGITLPESIYANVDGTKFYLTVGTFAYEVIIFKVVPDANPLIGYTISNVMLIASDNIVVKARQASRVVINAQRQIELEPFVIVTP